MSAPDNIRQLVELFDQHRKIESTDRQIDRLVYALSPMGMIYGLTKDEVKVVKGGGQQ